jgi:hypothetical protein
MKKKEKKKKRLLLHFSLFLSRLGQPSSTYECIAGSSLHVDEKVHQSDTREIISLICSFFFFYSKNIERERERERKKKRRRVRTALMTKHSFITTTAAIASPASFIHLSTSSKAI